MSVMSRILWSFNGERYADEASFNEAVRAYHIDIVEDDTRWRPDEIVIEAREIEVLYEYWEFDPVEREVIGALKLKAESEAGFRMGELLYQINEGVTQQLGEMDHKFFEGLSFGENGPGGIPRYWISLGS